jgi:hypothetical protein
MFQKHPPYTKKVIWNAVLLASILVVSYAHSRSLQGPLATMPSRGGAKRATGCSDVTDQDPPAKRGKAAAVASVPVAAAPQRVLRRGAAPAPAKTMTAAPAKSARAGRDKAPAKAPTKVTKTSAVAPQPRGTAAARGRGRSTRKVEVPAPEELDEDDAGSEESDDQEESENESSCDEDDATTAHGQFMQLLQAREEELGKHCVVLQQAEADEDEVTLEELRGLARVYVPPEVQDAFIEVRSRRLQPAVHALLRAVAVGLITHHQSRPAAAGAEHTQTGCRPTHKHHTSTRYGVSWTAWRRAVSQARSCQRLLPLCVPSLASALARHMR